MQKPAHQTISKEKIKQERRKKYKTYVTGTKMLYMLVTINKTWVAKQPNLLTFLVFLHGANNTASDKRTRQVQERRAPQTTAQRSTAKHAKEQTSWTIFTASFLQTQGGHTQRKLRLCRKKFSLRCHPDISIDSSLGVCTADDAMQQGSPSKAVVRQSNMTALSGEAAILFLAYERNSSHAKRF